MKVSFMKRTVFVSTWFVIPVFLTVVTFSSGCSLPRGAAIQSEVTTGVGATSTDFVVHPVTRETIKMIASWPSVDKTEEHKWPRTGERTIRVLAGDILNIVVWDSDESSLLVPSGARSIQLPSSTVSTSGYVYLPYVGNIKLIGKTWEDAKFEIQERLSEISPSLYAQVVISNGDRNSVQLVIGARETGYFPLDGNSQTLLGLIAKAGGVGQALRNPQVGLHRGENQYQIALERLRRNPNLDIPLLPGDKVFIEEDRRSFQVLGASGKEEIIYFDRNAITARQAVVMAGGLNDNRADPQSVLILREYPTSAVGRGPKKERVIFLIDLTSADGLFSANKFMVAPNDLVLVTESPVNSARTIFGLIGSAFGLTRQVQGL